MCIPPGQHAPLNMTATLRVETAAPKDKGGRSENVRLRLFRFVGYLRNFATILSVAFFSSSSGQQSVMRI